MGKLETKYWLEDTIVWAILCGFTILSYLQYEGLTNGSSSAGILIISLVKFLLVFFFFMKMEKAHILWKVLALGYLLLLSLVFAVF